MAKGHAGAATPVCEANPWWPWRWRGAGEPGQKPVPGFAAQEVIPDAAAATKEKFLTEKVRAGSHILSDGWRGYRRLKAERI
jgi:hypothetical protein